MAAKLGVVLSRRSEWHVCVRLEQVARVCAAHVDMAQQLNKPLVLEEFGLARDNAVHEVSGSVTWRDTYFSEMFAETLRHAEANSPLAGANVWAWGGEGRPRRPRKPDEPLLVGRTAGRWAIRSSGDPPHDAPDGIPSLTRPHDARGDGLPHRGARAVARRSINSFRPTIFRIIP